MSDAAACAPEQLQKTPLHAEHVRLGARMCGFGGWDMPLFYGTGQLKEHAATRNACGLFDVSHMGQVRFRGARTLEFLNRLVPGKMSKLADGESAYTQLCNPDGGIIDDLIITKFGSAEYFTVVNAATRAGDVAWIKQQATEMGFGDVSIEDESAAWAMIAVQGPGAFAMLRTVLPGERDWDKAPAFTMHPFTDENKKYLLSRTGYTGEAGGELLCPAETAVDWWNRFLAAGGTPCGLASRDSLRLEAGYCLSGQDIDLTTSPVEAGIGWSVDWKKPDQYIGRARLDRDKAGGVARKLTGLRINTRRPMRHGEAVVNAEGENVGVITSGGFSPGLNAGIALAYVQGAALGDGKMLFVQTRGDICPATVVKPPFVEIGLSKK